MESRHAAKARGRGTVQAIGPPTFPQPESRHASLRNNYPINSESMKPRRAWIVLNSNGNPACGVSESIFDDRKFALEMAKAWMAMSGRYSPNAKLTLHRVTIALDARSTGQDGDKHG